MRAQALQCVHHPRPPAHAQPRLLITAIALLLLGLVANHFLQYAGHSSHRPAGNTDRTGACHGHARTGQRPPAFLPAEALQTIALIQRRWPFPHRQDGSTFGNRDSSAAAASARLLPRIHRGHFGARTRGTRRIVAAAIRRSGTTDDHYESFRSFTVPAQGAQ